MDKDLNMDERVKIWIAAAHSVAEIMSFLEEHHVKEANHFLQDLLSKKFIEYYIKGKEQSLTKKGNNKLSPIR